MALNITYFGNADRSTRQVYGTVLSSVAYTVTGASASVGTLPTNAGIARLNAGEACYVSNNGSPASSTNGVYLSAGQTIDIECRPSTNLLAITG